MGMARGASQSTGGGARQRRSLRSKNGKGGFLSWEWGSFFIFGVWGGARLSAGGELRSLVEGLRRAIAHFEFYDSVVG